MSEDEHIGELFAKTLVGDYDDDEPWAAVRALNRIGSRAVFERAAQWCASIDPLKRARGLDVLAQLGKTAEHPSNSFPTESFSIAAGIVQQETDELPLHSAIFALGHLDDTRAGEIILPFISHSAAEIRFAVAWALGNYASEPQSTKALLCLMTDTDEDVRDWATFGLGSCSEVDSPEVRDALLQRMSDSFADVRYEAMVGQGKRRDDRVVPYLVAALEESPVTYWTIEAAYLMLGNGQREDWTAKDYAAALNEQFGAAK